MLYNSAYMAEILRGAWSRLPPDYAAGRALSFGFHGFTLYRRIILPPIVLAAAPVIGNQVIQVIKDTAFLMIIAVPELTHAASSHPVDLLRALRRLHRRGRALLGALRAGRVGVSGASKPFAEERR